MKLEILTLEKVYTVLREDGKDAGSLLDILQEEGIFIAAPCGGRGSCGRCRVRVCEAEDGNGPETSIPPDREERNIFSEAELAAGWRLACRLYPAGDMRIELESSRDAEMEILGVKGFSGGAGFQAGVSRETIVAIDIGTTTLAMALAEKESGRVLDTYLSVNHQRSFGADVMSRLQAVMEGKQEQLTESIRRDLKEGIRELISKNGITPERIVIAGNTTMLHLLMGYPCAGLGSYPFTPYSVEAVETTEEKLFSGKGGISEEREAEPDSEIPTGRPDSSLAVSLLPGISAFVGADMIADMLVCGMEEKKESMLLLDLGTNAEMAADCGGRLFVTSAAAGPAFEGGRFRYASDAVEALYDLRRSGQMDETGLLSGEYEGEITQKDIRELQLAKAAVRTGIEILLRNCGCAPEAVDRVYLAGGFGQGMDLQKAADIGLIPDCFVEKTEILGNGSLEGALYYGRKESAKRRAKELAGRAEEIVLAKEEGFQEIYFSHMGF